MIHHVMENVLLDFTPYVRGYIKRLVGERNEFALTKLITFATLLKNEDAEEKKLFLMKKKGSVSYKVFFLKMNIQEIKLL